MCGFSSTQSEGEVMSTLYVGIDLAKHVFAVHGVNEAGAAELRQPSVARAKLHALIASLPPCVIGGLLSEVAHIDQRPTHAEVSDEKCEYRLPSKGSPFKGLGGILLRVAR
jgi:hypothetical protein